jgi:3-deoxy-manno-octulosonate cytidylyltransferase (CMP-KDO synthetase)
MTRPDHPSGTDRIAEVADARGWSDDTVVVNVQGDEPRIAPSLIREMADLLAEPSRRRHRHCLPSDRARRGSLRSEHREGRLRSRRLRAVLQPRHDPVRAGLVPRIAAPCPRDCRSSAHRHLRVSACAFLRAYASLEPAPIEQYEALEQLRALWHGHRIAVGVTPHAPEAGVDTPEDLERVRALFASGPGTASL